MTTERESPQPANYMQQLPGGVCFAHGPHPENLCPQWPKCATDPQKPEFVAMGAQHLSTGKLPTRESPQEGIRTVRDEIGTVTAFTQEAADALGVERFKTTPSRIIVTEAVPQDGIERAREYLAKQPHCIGYPKCDGDLTATPHSDECPISICSEPGLDELLASYAASEVSRVRRETLAEVLKEVARQRMLYQQERAFAEVSAMAMLESYVRKLMDEAG